MSIAETLKSMEFDAHPQRDLTIGMQPRGMFCSD